MPIYEYICQDCHHEFEEIQKFDEAPLETCPGCGQKKVQRKVSASAFHLKGGGWYKDGYSNASGTSAKDSVASGSGDTTSEKKHDSQSDSASVSKAPDSSKPEKSKSETASASTASPS